MTPEEREELRRRVFSGDKVDKEALRKLSDDIREEREDGYLDKAIELWMAGWTSHSVGKNDEIMSWYWRRKPKAGRKKGKLFLSTDQALRALRKEQGKPAPQ